MAVCAGSSHSAARCAAELAKVDFPNRQQTWQATMVVVAACVIVGMYLYGLDQVFARFATKLVDLQR